MRTPKNLLDSEQVRDVVGTDFTVLVTNGPGETTFLTNIAGNYDGDGEASLQIYSVEPEGSDVGGETSAATIFGPESLYGPDHHTFLFGVPYPGIIFSDENHSVQAKAIVTGSGMVTISITGAKE